MEVEFFSSTEEAIERLEEARKAANGRVKPWQAQVKQGQYFVVVCDEGLVIYGEVLEDYQEERLQHYRFCKCYSVACPQGELGDVHVSTITRVITKVEFDEAHQSGWLP